MKTGRRYHIESGVSLAVGFSKLTGKPFSETLRKQRVHQAGQRRTVGFFEKRKFGATEVQDTLADYHFKLGQYERVIVTWGWTDEAAKQAKAKKIVLWDFRKLVAEIADEVERKRTYFTDDTLRTIHLFVRAGHARK